MAKILDTQAYLDTVCALLHEGHTHVPVTVEAHPQTAPLYQLHPSISPQMTTDTPMGVRCFSEKCPGYGSISEDFEG